MVNFDFITYLGLFVYGGGLLLTILLMVRQDWFRRVGFVPLIINAIGIIVTLTTTHWHLIWRLVLIGIIIISVIVVIVLAVKSAPIAAIGKGAKLFAIFGRSNMATDSSLSECPPNQFWNPDTEQCEFPKK